MRLNGSKLKNLPCFGIRFLNFASYCSTIVLPVSKARQPRPLVEAVLFILIGLRAPGGAGVRANQRRSQFTRGGANLPEAEPIGIKVNLISIKLPRLVA